MSKGRRKVTIATDGACRGNPGPGGWSAILRCDEHRKEIAGYKEHATNNGMELDPVVAAISMLTVPCDITLRSDSHYICTGIANMPIWKKNGWKLKSGAVPKHVEKWQKLDRLIERGGHKLHYEYVPGHSGDPDNERCDFLAKEQIKLNAKGA